MNVENLKTEYYKWAESKSTPGYKFGSFASDVFNFLSEKQKQQPAQVEGSYYYPLFELLHREHGVLALDTELSEIVDVVKEMTGTLTTEKPGIDFDAIGEAKIQDAIIVFEEQHGYELPTKEDRFNGKRNNSDYLYYSHCEVNNNEVRFIYNEQTPHDCPYHVVLSVPITELQS